MGLKVSHSFDRQLLGKQFIPSELYVDNWNDNS